MRIDTYNRLLTGIMTVIIVLAGMLIVKYQMPRKIVKADLVAITSHYTEMIMKEGGSKDNPKVKVITDLIKNHLEPIVNAYAKSHNVIIIQSQALISSDIPDITEEIIKALDKKLESGK